VVAEALPSKDRRAQVQRKGLVPKGRSSRTLLLQRKTILFSRVDLIVADTQILEKFNQSLVDPHNLGTLEAKAGHQTLLIEREGVDAAMDSVCSEAAGHPFVHDDNARAGANLPAARVVYPIHRLLVHQEESVTVPLNAGLQAIGGGYGPVAAVRSAVHEKESLAPLSAEDKAGLHYIRKHKNGDCSRFTFGGCRILGHELLQSAAGITGQIVGGCYARAK
jgi:hypothetical protein